MRRLALKARDNDDDEPHQSPETGAPQTPGFQRPSRGKPPATWTPRRRPQHTATSPCQAPEHTGRRAPARPMPESLSASAISSSPAPDAKSKQNSTGRHGQRPKTGRSHSGTSASHLRPTPVPPRPGDARRPAAGHTVGGGGGTGERTSGRPHTATAPPRSADRQNQTLLIVCFWPVALSSSPHEWRL